MGYETRIPVESDTRDRLRAMKRGRQTYDELLREFADRFETEGKV
ncbi:hypothetical protein [Haloferax sp. Atlit-19N]|nr:hypothetical protein [Haloferax sp. Atlit-19N]